MALDYLDALRATFALTAFALAAILLRARGNRTQNRLLASWLALLGAGEAATLPHAIWPASYPWALVALVASVVRGGTPFVFLAFLGTLQTTLARPFADPVARRVAVAAGITTAVLSFAFLDEFARLRLVGTTWEAGGQPPYVALLVAGATIAAYAAIVAIDALRQAPRGSLERSRAWMLLVAILLIEGIIGAHQALMLGLDAIDDGLHFAYMRGPIGLFVVGPVRYAAALVGFAVLVYGMLRVQLFDADLRVKWTLRSGTVGAVFVGAFLVVSQLAQGFLSETYGWALGGLGAALLLLAIHPIQRLAERVAETAMPGVRDTPEWRDARKNEVYRTAVRLAIADRAITREKEIHLADLATQLGIDARRALDLRHSVEGETAAT